MRPRSGTALIVFLCLLGLVCFHIASLPGASVTGSVWDNNGPVAQARVRYQGTDSCTLTDRDGRFRLPAPTSASQVITAWKQGYFIAGSRSDRPGVAISLRPFPTEDNEKYAWVDPTPAAAQAHNCGNCHPAIHDEWAASAHAWSVRNRHFLNLYEGSDWQGRPNAGWSLLRQHPDGSGVCTACHAPTIALSDPAYFDLRKVQGVGALGIHCDFCHKVADASVAPLGLTHGRFGLTLLRPKEGQLFFGPLDDVDRGEDTFAPVYRESRYCASCHEGTLFGVPVYTTYSEWLVSPARREGKECQTCHMTPTGMLTNIAPGKGGIERKPMTLASHTFPGGQVEMLRRCLNVSVDWVADQDEIRVAVAVRCDNVGHRVPTGFVDRNLMLLVEGIRATGETMKAVSGPVLPPSAGPGCAGLAGRLYAKQLSDFAGRGPVPFWMAQPDIVDSRLAPGETDRSEYRFPKGLARLRVRLLYRRFWPEVAKEKLWPDNEIVVFDRTFH